jgi:hypothetical protein
VGVATTSREQPPAQPSTQLKRWGPWLVAIAAALPVPILVWLDVKRAILAPFLDEFNLVPLIHKLLAHTLTFSDLMAQHNEHRLFFPQLLMLTMADISHWAIAWEIAASSLFAVLSTLLIIQLLRQTFPDQTLLRRALIVLFSWIVLSPAQFENWLWGWQVQWLMTVLALLVVVAVLSPPKALSWKHLAIAAAAATVADYSLASGVLAWVVGLIVLFCRGESARRKWVWTTAAVLIAAPYYYHYHSTSNGSLSYAVKHLFTLIEYTVVYLGGPLAHFNLNAAKAFGALELVVFLAAAVYIGLRRRAELARLGPWIGIALFAGAGAVLTGEGRLKLGLYQALASRYVTISLLFLVATIVIAAVSLEAQLRAAPRLVSIAAAVSVLAVGALTVAAYQSGISHSKNFPVAHYRRCLQRAGSAADPCLLYAFPVPQYAFEQITYLRKIRWAGF